MWPRNVFDWALESSVTRGFCPEFKASRSGDDGGVGDDGRVFAQTFAVGQLRARGQGRLEERRRTQVAGLQIDQTNELLRRRLEVELLIGASRFSIEHARADALHVRLGRIAVLSVGRDQLRNGP